jgi:DNA-binding protein HU-beta
MKKAIDIPVVEMDIETDDLLSRIAQSGDKLDSALLRAIIPSREAYVQYLEQHRLTDYSIAKEVLAQFDALKYREKRARENQNRQTTPRRALTKTALVRHMAERLELTAKQSAAFLDLLAETALGETKRNGVFAIPGLGRLVRAERKARTGRNPQTGQAIKITAKSSVRFRVAKSAKDAIAAKGKKA